MLELLGKIDIHGTKSSIDKCASLASIPNGIIMQIGLKRKIPDVDSWTYESPLYRFRLDAMDYAIRDFLATHFQVGTALAERDAGIEYAFFTLVPVVKNSEDTFAGIFSCETLKLLANMGLELQISPEAIMPDAPYWKR